MKRVSEIGASALAFTTVLALSTAAQAQDAAPAAAPAAAPTPAPAPETATVGGGAQAGGGMALPGAAPAQAVAGDSDHDAVIGTLGVGYLGMNGIGIGAGAGNAAAQVVDAPIVGVRYWLDQMVGIDAGLGIGVHGGSRTEPAPVGDVPQQSTTGFLLHGGVPLNLASAGHFSFQIVPEMNVGFGSASQDIPNGGGTTSQSGFHFDLGGRAGAEIHFGFMGLPKLSLQGSVGLKLAIESHKSEVQPTGAATATTKNSSTDFGTTLGDNPWNIFRANVAALYYF